MADVRSSVCPHLKTLAPAPAPLATTCVVTVCLVKVGYCPQPAVMIYLFSTATVHFTFSLAACFVKGGQRKQLDFSFLSPLAFCCVSQVWVPFWCTLFMRGYEGSRWIPVTTPRPWCPSAVPCLLLASTFMQVQTLQFFAIFHSVLQRVSEFAVCLQQR